MAASLEPLLSLRRHLDFKTGDPAVVLHRLLQVSDENIKAVRPMGSTRYFSASNLFQFGPPGYGSTLTSYMTSGHQVDGGPQNDFRVFVARTRPLRIRAGRSLREIVPAPAIGLCPASEYMIESSGRNLMLRVRASRIEAVLALLNPDADTIKIRNRYFLDPSIKGLDILLDLISHTVRCIDQEVDGIIDLPAFKAAHDELLVLRAAQVLANAAAPNDRVAAAYDKPLLGRSVEFINAYAAGPIGLADLAHHCGASLRTLQILFRRELNCTITQYILRTRLERAHGMLKSADPGMSITGIALQCGFNHLSQFAQSYRSAFGELPSSTLRRSRWERAAYDDRPAALAGR
jgi:AraC-like DNA-binding protein